MSPLIKSRKEFVMRTPGISSMIFPIMIISTCCPGPTRHIRMHAIPEIREHKIFEKIAFIWTFANAYSVTRINAPHKQGRNPSHKFPPKRLQMPQPSSHRSRTASPWNTLVPSRSFHIPDRSHQTTDASHRSSAKDRSAGQASTYLFHSLRSAASA